MPREGAAPCFKAGLTHSHPSALWCFSLNPSSRNNKPPPVTSSSEHLFLLSAQLTLPCFSVGNHPPPSQLGGWIRADSSFSFWLSQSERAIPFHYSDWSKNGALPKAKYNNRLSDLRFLHRDRKEVERRKRDC